MAYNNIFPMSYQNPYYQQVMPQQMQPQNLQQANQQQIQNSNIIWVSGEAGAKSYLVAPNTTVQLWDSESQTIYLKSADASGMPSIKTLDYTIRAENQPIQTISDNSNKFILRDEFNGLKAELDGLKSELNKLKPHKKEGKQNG